VVRIERQRPRSDLVVKRWTARTEIASEVLQSGNGVDLPVCNSDLTYPAAIQTGNIDVPGRIQCDRRGVLQGGACRGPAVATYAAGSISCECADDAGGCRDLANTG